MDNLFESHDYLNAPFETFEGDWTYVKPHWHYFTEMVYLVRGTLVTEVNNRQYTLNAGDMVIFHPKQIHAFLDCPTKSADVEKPYFYGIKFDTMILSNTTPGSPKLPKLLENITNMTEPYNLITAEELQYNPVKLYFEHCIWETHHKEFGYDIKVTANISLLITELMRIWKRRGMDISTKHNFDQFSTKDFSVLEYIDKHSAENISVEDLANRCGMCYSNFAKQFKTQYGKTCKEYIEFIRICKADTLLLYTDKTLDYISQETGFTDASHFIRTYKKIKGTTPKQRRMSK